MNPKNPVLRFLLNLYLGKRGYRASLIAYGIGFWIFGAGTILMFLTQETQSALLLGLRGILINVGLLIVVLMTYPVIYCAFQVTDKSRPKSQFRRILEPTIVGALSPLYLMLLVASFITSVAGPILFGG
jgi:hypothetical protein